MSPDPTDVSTCPTPASPTLWRFDVNGLAASTTTWAEVRTALAQQECCSVLVAARDLLTASVLLHEIACQRLPLVLVVQHGPADPAIGGLLADQGWLERQVAPDQPLTAALTLAHSVAGHPDVRLPVALHLTAQHPFALPSTPQTRRTPDTRSARQEALQAALALLATQDGGTVEAYCMDEADYALVVPAGLSVTARAAIDRARAQSEMVGLVIVHSLRPFPLADLHELLTRVSALGVVETDVLHGWRSGPLHRDVLATLCGYDRRIPVTSLLCHRPDAAALDAAIAATARCYWDDDPQPEQPCWLDQA